MKLRSVSERAQIFFFNNSRTFQKYFYYNIFLKEFFCYIFSSLRCQASIKFNPLNQVKLNPIPPPKKPKNLFLSIS